MKDKTLSLTFCKEDINFFEKLIKEGRDKEGIIEHIITQWYLASKDDEVCYENDGRK